VTIWGESAGDISVSLQMAANDGKPERLFRGAPMQSGSPLPVGDLMNAQKCYEDPVRNTGCSGASDTLHYLRNVPTVVMQTAVDKGSSLVELGERGHILL